jgi:EF hand
MSRGKHRAKALAAWPDSRFNAGGSTDNRTNETTNRALYRGKHMTTKAAKKNRSRLQQDFIPNFEMRSVLVIATFAVSAAYAQTATRPASPGQNNPVAMTTAADRADNTAMASQVKTASNPVDAAFNRADTDHDGRLSRKEAEHFPMLSQRFDTIDTNRDSFISREEFDRAVGN